MAVGQLVGFSHEGKKIVGTGTMYGSEFYHENQDPMKVKKYVITSVQCVMKFIKKKHEQEMEIFKDLHFYRARQGPDNYYAKYKCVNVVVHPKYTGPLSGFDICIVMCQLVNKKDLFKKVKPDSFLFSVDYNPTENDTKNFIIKWPKEQ